MQNLQEKLFEAILPLPILDTHEHLPAFQKDREMPCDVLTEFLSHYFDKDLISAGMPAQILEKAMDTTRPVAERFRELEPWWDLCRYTGYGRSLDLSAKGVYGIDGVHGNTIEALQEAFAKGVEDPGHFRHVLKDLCHIERSISDCWVYATEPGWFDEELFFQSRNIGHLSGSLNNPAKELFEMLKANEGVEITSLDNLCDAITAQIKRAPAAGYAGYKITTAYCRSLYFREVPREEAKAAFLEVHTALRKGENPTLPVAMQDYLMHVCLEQINKQGDYLQIHTGLQEGNGNIVSRSDPEPLCWILMKYPDIKFDVFHIGYPYWQKLGTMAKIFPHMNVDFCWANIISPKAVVDAMDEYLDLMPRNKIFFFGGDYLFVDGVYGHQMMARQNLARALARKVEQGVFDMDEAVYTAKLVLHDNVVNRLNLKI